MSENEITALVTLLEDSDEDVSLMVEKEIKNQGEVIIPYLEDHWEKNSLNPDLQKRIEDIIHDLHFQNFSEGLMEWKNERQDDLLKGMFLLARYQYPELEYEKLKLVLNQIYFDAWLQLRDEIHPNDAVKILNHIFFDKYKFSANTKNFHSPSNSLINKVLETKRGNPISLCVIYLLIAQRLGLPIYGVNLPSLFILTYKSSQVQFYINVFNNGLIFNKKDISTYLKQLKLEQEDAFFEPCSNLEIIKRSLLNLMVSYKKSSENEKVKEIKEVYDNMMK
jgi:regulator of sirC expression with transglutaminase-like and TPR domain